MEVEDFEVVDEKQNFDKTTTTKASLLRPLKKVPKKYAETLNQHILQKGFIDHYLRAVIFVIYSEELIKNEIQPFFRSQYEEKSIPTCGRNLQQVSGFFEAGGCYIQTIMDVTNAEKLFSDAYKKYLPQIGEITIYIPEKEYSTLYYKYHKLKTQYHPKITNYVSDLKKQTEKLKPYMQHFQQFSLNEDKKVALRTELMPKNMHRAYFLVDGENITEMQQYKLCLVGQIKLVEDGRSTLIKMMEEKFIGYLSYLAMEICRNFLNNTKDTKEKSLCEIDILNSNAEYEQLTKDKKILKNSQIDHTIYVFKFVSRQPNYWTKQQNRVKIIVLYKKETNYYKILNSIVRAGKRSLDFDIIGLPFAETFLVIKSIYHQNINQKGKRQEVTILRMAKLQDLQKLVQSEGKYCQLTGFTSCSLLIEKTLPFKDEKCPQGFIILRIRIPQFQYKSNDQRLKDDHGFIDFQKDIINKDEKLYVETMKTINPNWREQSKDQEQEIIINSMNIYKIIGQGKHQENGKIYDVLDLEYTTKHQMEDEKKRLQKLIQESETNSQSRKSMEINIQSQKLKLQQLKQQHKYLNTDVKLYLTFYENFKKSRNAGDILTLRGDSDGAKEFYEKYLPKNLQKAPKEDLFKYAGVCIICNGTLQFDLTKQLSKNITFEENPSQNKIQVQNAVTQKLKDQEDNLALVDMLKRKIKFLENYPDKWYEMAVTLHRIAELQMIDCQWSDARKNLELLSLTIIKSRQDVEKQVQTNCCIPFKRIFSGLFGKNEVKNEANVQNTVYEDKKIVDLMIQIHFSLMKCEKAIHDNQQISSVMEEEVEKEGEKGRNKTQIEKINKEFQKRMKNLKSQFDKLIERRKLVSPQNKLPNEFLSLQIQVNNLMPSQSTKFRSNLLRVIQQQLITLKQINPKSIDVAELLQLENSLQENIRQERNSPASKYLVDSTSTLCQTAKKLRGFKKCTKMFNTQAYRKEVQKIIQNTEEAINIFAYLQGETIDVSKKRAKFALFLSQNNQIDKSISQSFKIINTSHGEKHSVGAEAAYFLSMNFHSMGLQKKAFEKLTIGQEIIRRAKLKEQTKEYTKIYEISQIKLKLDMMRAKLYSSQLKRDMKKLRY